jgi:hypothetical protein
VLHFGKFRSDILLNLYERAFIRSSNTVLDMNLNHIIFTDKFRILLNTLVCSNINFIDVLRALLPLHSIIQILNLSECIFSLLVSLTFILRCDFILLLCCRCVQFVALHEQTQYKEENYDASCDGAHTALILLRLFGL